MGRGKGRSSETQEAAQALAGPHEPAVKRAVIGAVLVSESAWHMADELQVDAFAIPAHRTIWRTVLELRAGRHPLDVRTIEAELSLRERLADVGGIAYLTGLEMDLPDLSRVDFYASILVDRQVRRSGRQVCLEAASDFTNGEDTAERVSGNLRRRLMQIETQATPAVFSELGPSLDRLSRSIFEGVETEEGIETGFPDVDRMLHAMVPGDVHVIAGGTGSGKTCLATNIAQNVLRAGLKVAIFSLEMRQEELATRIVASESQVNHDRLRSGEVALYDQRDVEAAIERMKAWPLLICDDASITVQQMLAASRRQRERQGLDLVIVDYLQIVQPSTRREVRENEVAEVSRELKLMANDLDIPVVALSQLSRRNVHEKRSPELSDLRESGAIEQDASVVMALWRPDKHDRNNVDLCILKNRHGKIGTVPLYFRPEILTFRSADR